MKTIEVDDELYQYIASQTRHIGESASDILRRMLKISAASQPTPVTKDVVSQPSVVAQVKPAVMPAKDKVRAMRELLLSDEYAEQKKAVNRFMLVLSTLYSLDNNAFAEATESLHGRTRVYFAGDEQTLLQNGNQNQTQTCSRYAILGDHQYQYGPQVQHDRTYHAVHAVPGGIDRKGLRYNLTLASEGRAMANHSRAGQPAQQRDLINVAQLTAQYYVLKPVVGNAEHAVKFGTSGHRGSAARHSFNEPHILAIAQAIAEERAKNGVTGPCYVGKDTHALSEPAFISVLEVLAANGVDVIVQENNGFTPTPAVSNAILVHNKKVARRRTVL